MEKTKHESITEIERVYVLPKTLRVQTESMPLKGVNTWLYPVYGKTEGDRTVWCATFLDSDEASSWVMASKTLGRAVLGAVILKQESINGAGENSREETQEKN